ncbi:uncharacterized protein [Rhodnius prolixus]|uniref:Putative viral protein n=3 Tax=Rhodnius TaxID=13248 RepID=R4G533_RHOPR
MERIPTVNNCCWFFDLETGTKIIGFLEAIIYGIWFTLNVIALLHATRSENAGYYSDNGTIIFALVIDIFMFIIAVLLLVGVYKKRKSFVKVWLIVQTVILILMIILLILIILTFNIAGIVSNIISICLLIYALLVVLSYYRGAASNPATTSY